MSEFSHLKNKLLAEQVVLSVIRVRTNKKAAE